MKRLTALILLGTLALSPVPARAGLWRDCKGFLAAGAVGLGITAAVSYPIVTHVRETRAITAALESFSPEELAKLRASGAVRLGGEVYTVRKGYLFALPADGPPRAVRGVGEIADVLKFKNLLVARLRDGSVHLYEPAKREWIAVGKNAAQAAASGDELIVLTRGGEIQKYRGEPGDLIVSYIPITNFIFDGKGNATPITTYMPYVSGRKLAFEDTGISGVERIDFPDSDADADAIQITFRDGTSSRWPVRGAGGS